MDILSYLTALLLIIPARAQLYDILYEDLTADINRHTIPVVSRSTPLNVSIGLSLIQILSVDTVKGNVELDAWLTYQWRDDRVTWDPANYDDIAGIVLPYGSIWTPDITLYYGRATYEDRNIVVNDPNGEVQTGRAARITLRCDVDDYTNASRLVACRLVFGSWSYDGLSLNLWSTHAEIELAYFQKDDWEVTSTSAARDVKTYSCCTETYPDVNFSFTIKDSR